MSEVIFDQPYKPRPTGYFRLDVALSVATGIFLIEDGDTAPAYWRNHPHETPVEQELKDFFAYMTADQGAIEFWQFVRLRDEVGPSLRTQIRETTEFGAILDSVPPEEGDETGEKATAWYKEIIGNHPMDRLVKLVPIKPQDHIRVADPYIELDMLREAIRLVDNPEAK